MSQGSPVNIKGVTWFFWTKTNPLDTNPETSLIQTPISFTIASITHRLMSATGLASLDYDLRHGSSVSAGGGTKIITAGFTSDDTGSTETSFDSADIAGDDYIWIEYDILTDGPAQQLMIRVVLA